jgi:hypothetical protein
MIYQSNNEGSAYVINALYELDTLESTVHDILTGRNDLFAKASLVGDIASIRTNLKRALI